MTITSLDGTVKDTNARLVILKTESGDKQIMLAGNSPMDNLLEDNVFVGYHAVYTSNGTHYKIQFSKDFTYHVLFGSIPHEP
jgi:hypothetical protein